MMKHLNVDQCLIFAHRGANKEAAENTRGAFDKALAYPIDGIETDVQLTLDDILVLWHDELLEKLGHPEKHIDDFTYSDLAGKNFAAHFPAADTAEGVLGLMEFIDNYRGRCQLQIEIKNFDYEPVQRHEIKMRHCLDLIGANPDKDVFISSFNLHSLIYARQFTEDIPLYYAIKTHHDTADVHRFLKEQPFLQGLCLPIDILDETMTRALRDYGKGIVTYTCNTPEQIGKALNLSVDVIITDYPEKALHMRAEHQGLID